MSLRCGRSQRDSGVPRTCSREAAVPVPAMEVGDRALSWGPLVLMGGWPWHGCLACLPPMLARGTRAGQSHDHYPALPLPLHLSIPPPPSLITHIPHPASSLLRLGEGGGGGAPTPSPGGGLGESRACDMDTVRPSIRGKLLPALGTPGWRRGTLPRGATECMRSWC